MPTCAAAVAASKEACKKNRGQARRPVPVLLLYRSQRWALTVVAVSVMPVMLFPFVAFVPFTAPAAVVRRSVVIGAVGRVVRRSEEHTSELQSRGHLVCRLLLEK